MENDIITLLILGVILIVTGVVLMLADKLDGFALGLALTGVIAIGVSAVAAIVLLVGSSVAFGRDLDGRFAESPLHDWFEKLASKKGRCCSDADGYAISDVDWESSDGHYRVHLPNKAKPGDPVKWVDVPDDALITEPNRAGRAMVWPIYGVPKMQIRCFMVGPVG